MLMAGTHGETISRISQFCKRPRNSFPAKEAGIGYYDGEKDGIGEPRGNRKNLQKRIFLIFNILTNKCAQ